MSKEAIDRVAFAIQDSGMTWIAAQRYARAALAVLRPGDRLGSTFVVCDLQDRLEPVEAGSTDLTEASSVESSPF